MRLMLLFKNKWLLYLVFIIFIVAQISNTAFAMLEDQRKVFQKNINHFDVNSCDNAPSLDDTSSSDSSVDIAINGPFKPKPVPSTKVNVGYASKGKASSYGEDPKTGYVDPGDVGPNGKPLKPALAGATNKDPGIAVYNSGSLGGWWKVIAPNNKSAILRQTDLGPSTSRTVDINSVAARSVFGYKVGDKFPTDEGTWKIEYIGKVKPAGAISSEGDSPDASTSKPSSCCAGGNNSSLVGKDNTEKAFNFFRSKGLSPEQSAGIVGNLMVESGEKLDTRADNGSHWGIAQWDSGRWNNLKKHSGGDIYDLGNQLEFIWYELNETPSMLGAIKSAKSASDATLAFQNQFERCGSAAACAQSNRLANAQKVLNKYGNGGSSGSSSASSGGCQSSNNGTCEVSSPIVTRQYSQEELKKLFGNPGTASSHSDMDKNLTTVKFLDKSVSVHKKIAGCLEAVSNDIKSKSIRYTIKDMGCYRFDSDNGSSNIGLRSYHTYGVACDINPSTNPFTSGGSAPYDMPKEYIKIFKDHGFTWGGDWHSVKDYMHFEFHGAKP